jgi:hypothetical protein
MKRDGDREGARKQDGWWTALKRTHRTGRRLLRKYRPTAATYAEKIAGKIPA